MKPTVQDLLARKRAKTAGAADKATGEAGAGDVDPATATGPGTGTAPIKGTAPPPSADASSSLATADAAAARQMSKRSEKSPVKVGLARPSSFAEPGRLAALLTSISANLYLPYAPLQQPLNDIVDLSKLVSQSPEGIAAIWNGFHQLAGNERALSAVIPYDIYRKMQERARKYSSFVVPVPREIQTAPAAGSAGAAAEGTKQTGHEMHFLVSGRTAVAYARASRLCTTADTSNLSNGRSCPRPRSPAARQSRPSSSPRWASTRRSRRTHSRISS